MAATLKIVTPEQLQQGWIELRGATPIHHNFIVLGRRGKDYVVRNPIVKRTRHDNYSTVEQP